MTKAQYNLGTSKSSEKSEETPPNLIAPKESAEISSIGITKKNKEESKHNKKVSKASRKRNQKIKSKKRKFSKRPNKRGRKKW